MPRELVAVGPREPVLREYAEPPLQADQNRIRSEFSAPKHGTELGRYRGTSAFNRARYDPTLQHFVPRTDSVAAFPFRLGNMTIGVVTEVGSNVRRYRVG